MMTIGKPIDWDNVPETLAAQKPVCAECGSDDMEAHALLSWSDQLQD